MQRNVDSTAAAKGAHAAGSKHGRLELAIAAALLVFLSVGLAFAETPVGGMSASSVDTPDKRTTTEEAIREYRLPNGNATVPI